MSPFTPEQIEEIRRIVRDELKANRVLRLKIGKELKKPQTKSK